FKMNRNDSRGLSSSSMTRILAFAISPSPPQSFHCAIRGQPVTTPHSTSLRLFFPSAGIRIPSIGNAVSAGVGLRRVARIGRRLGFQALLHQFIVRMWLYLE